MKKLEQCPVCNGKDIIPFLKTKDYSTSKEYFYIVSCETCGFSATSPRPYSKDLDRYYISESYISHTNNKDVHSLGNEEADKLAIIGANL